MAWAAIKPTTVSKAGNIVFGKVSKECIDECKQSAIYQLIVSTR